VLRTGSLTAAGLIAAALMGACGTPATLTQLMDARRQGATLMAHFEDAAGAANRAVMADEDADAAAAGQNARAAREAIHQDVATLRSLLESLRFSQELGYLAGFAAALDDYERLDDEILGLAVENSNVKAQRLSFGAAREAADAFSSALDAAVDAADPAVRARAKALAVRGRLSVLEVQVLYAPHIAEAEDQAMTILEQQMNSSAAAARESLAAIRNLLRPGGIESLRMATMALDRFQAVQAEIVALSRRNSDVRSIALTLGKKRMLTARCQDQLQSLEKARAERGSSAATR
jgi:hypothetical protein